MPASVTRRPSGCRHVSCDPDWRTSVHPDCRSAARTSRNFFAIAQHAKPEIGRDEQRCGPTDHLSSFVEIIAVAPAVQWLLGSEEPAIGRLARRDLLGETNGTAPTGGWWS
jgi:hypothetical protein